MFVDTLVAGRVITIRFLLVLDIDRHDNAAYFLPIGCAPHPPRITRRVYGPES